MLIQNKALYLHKQTIKTFNKIMKKFFYLFVFLFLCVACERQSVKLEKHLTKTLFTEILTNLQSSLRDPGSLKIEDIPYVYKITQDEAREFSDLYHTCKLVIEEYNKHFPKQKKEWEYDPLVLDKLDNVTNVEYFLIGIQYNAKNGFGGYGGTSTMNYIIEIGCKDYDKKTTLPQYETHTLQGRDDVRLLVDVEKKCNKIRDAMRTLIS